jgi:hypothetical protein
MDPLLFMLFQFEREFHREPDDAMDFFDGIDAMAVRAEIETPEGK